MYLVVCDNEKSKPSPPIALKFIAEKLAKTMSNKTGRKYYVIVAEPTEGKTDDNQDKE